MARHLFRSLLILLLLAGWSIGATAGEAVYQLGSGDRVRVTVFGEPDLSGEFEVGVDGTLAMPLVGEIRVMGQSLREAERTLEGRLAQGYLKQPRASIDVLNYRPFYILGEVKIPGKYPFETGMTVLTAVTLAGGFTYRADEKDIDVVRGGNKDGPMKKVPLDTVVQPGDTIRVNERFF
ncbi:MAG: polysaccharide export protein [Alphaproteobacteria bacterium]|nr:polysaccharide export protein [Alphaproteobacteria bacterium]MBF0395028.1 polysaccharide export protein [Alphaproteobacteria bacterium]